MIQKFDEFVKESKNANLHAAKSAKNDEFYTQLGDIEKEMVHYKEHFRGKTIYCNCDDPRESNFFKFFSSQFEHLGLKKLITTGYKPDGHGVSYIYEGDKNGNRIVDDEEVQITELKGTGDFRSPECIEFLKEADIVVTNPPFSLFREYVAQLMEYGKKFILVAPKNCITYKEVFPLFKENKMWIGAKSMSGSMYFPTPAGAEHSADIDMNGTRMSPIACCWFTNLELEKRHKKLDLIMHYDPKYYPKYDNYDAIEVSKSSDIPEDYDGVMGVPITFLDKYCPEQFEILDARDVALNEKQKNKSTYLIKDADGTINGKATYARICIRKK